MNETTVTVIGNLTGDPELRFTPAGHAVANFVVASTPRRLDRESGQWVDGDSLFLRCTLWRRDAENFAETAHRGDRVMVVGRLRQRSYETRAGETRSVIELEADEAGVSTRYATATVARNPKSADHAADRAAGQRVA